MEHDQVESGLVHIIEDSQLGMPGILLAARSHDRSIGSSARLLVVMLVILIVMCFLAFIANAQIPRTISYQGMLSIHNAPATGEHLITVSFYDSLTGGSLVYQESHQLIVSNGIVEMEIGSITPIPQSLAFDRPYYLGISVDGNPELSPRVALDAAPYALAAGTAQLAEGLAPDAHGVVTSINELAGPIHITGDSSTTITEDGNNIIIHARAVAPIEGIQSIASPDKTIAVANSAGPNVILGVADSAISTTKLADGAVTPQKLAQAGAKTGQVLKWNGSEWSTSNDSIGTNYVAGQGISISGNTISAIGSITSGTVLNSTLRWDGTAWVENQNMTSDTNGNTHINGATSLGDGIGADNIIMSPGTGHVQVSGWNQGVVLSNANGILSTSQLAGGLGVSITQSGTTITIADSSAIGWSLVGNTGTNAASNFLGTTDNQPFEIHVNNNDGMDRGSKRVERFEPNATSANIIAGFQGNSVLPGVVGATIAGGGLNGFNNTITDDFGVVGGGSFNRAGNSFGSEQDASHATVAGGGGNTASGMYSSVLGGTANTASGIGGAVGGGSTNQASGVYATVTGGIANLAADTAAIASGWSNVAVGTYSAISGGLQNSVFGSRSAIVGGGWLGMAGAGSFGFHNGTGRIDSAFVSAPGTAFFGNVNLWLGNTNNTASQLRLYGPQNGGINFPSPYTHYSSFAASGQTSDINYILPSAPPNSVQTLAATSVTGTGPYTITLGWTNSDGNSWSLTGNTGTSPATNFLGTIDNRDLVIKTNSIEAMRVASNGNVGIGTPGPTQKLTVVDITGADPVIFENNNNSSGLNQQSALTLENLATNTATTEIVFGHANASGLPWAGATIDMFPNSVAAGAERGSLIFGTNNTGGTSVTERMRLTNTGFLGIGTLNPLQKLNVENGNVLLSRTGINVNDTLEFQGNGTGYSAFAAGAQGSTAINYTLPVSQPLPNQVLTATGVAGAGPYNVTLGWASAGNSSGWGLTGNSGTMDGTNFLGTTDNVPFTIRANNVPAVRLQPSHNAVGNFIGGGVANAIASGDTASILAYGDSNYIAASYASNIGGALDTVTGDYSNITSSYGSTVTGEGSAIVGGEGNSVTSDLSVISGGYIDTIANTWDGFIGGGSHNIVKDEGGAIAGGELNFAYLNSFVGGGIANYAGAYSHSSSAVLGGSHNTAAGDNSIIAGGQDNAIPLSAIYSAVLSGVSNYAGGSNSAIVGGGYLRMSGNNSFGFHAGSSSTDSAAITTGNTAYFGNVNLWLGNTNNTPSQLRFYGAQNGGVNFPAASTHYSSFAAAGQTSDINYTLPSAAPSANGNLLLASSGAPSTMAWSTNLLWDNSNYRLGINTTSPMHSLHSVYSGTSDEYAAVYGNATGSTINQAIGVWGDASNTSTSNTGTIGVLATGNGNSSAGNTNVALQVNDGEFTMGRTTELPGTGSNVEPATGGTAYSQQGPSGIIELTLGAAGNLSTAAPTSGIIQDLGYVTINNQYCEAGSIVLANVVGMISDGFSPNPQNAAWVVNVDNTAAGSFVIRIKLIPTSTSGSNYSTNDKIRIGYMIVNKSK